MDIKKFEFRKILTSPIITILTLFFIVINIITIFNNSYKRNEIKVVNKIVDEVGYKIDDNMMVKFKDYYHNTLKNINNILKSKALEMKILGENSSEKTVDHKSIKIYKSIEEFIEENKFNILNSDEIYTKDEQNLIRESFIIEGYYNLSKNWPEEYEKINIMEMAEGNIEMFNITKENLKEIARGQFRKFEKRFQELIAKEEHKNLFFFGKANKMHTLLFKDLMRNIMYEIMIIVVLVTAYIISYEFENGTQNLVYTTRRGRNVIKDKLFISIACTLIVTTIILGVSLIVYFMVFDYSRVWNVPISNSFNFEFGPYLSWWNMSFGEYLILTIILVYICELIFGGITFVISSLINNSYFTFFIFAIILGVGIMMPSTIGNNSILMFASAFNPFCLMHGIGSRFMLNDVFTMFKYYEVITLSAWSILIIAFSIFGIKRFKKKNIC